MRSAWLSSLAIALTVLALSPGAAQAAEAAGKKEALAAARKTPQPGSGEKKFCCTSPSGKACYVFGSASCSACETFCKGPTGPSAPGVSSSPRPRSTAILPFVEQEN
jgi:hypothetical protein